jgi:hypothetical protein
MRNLACTDASLQPRIPFDLRNADSSVSAVQRVVVIAVILKGLPERRCAIKAHYTVRREGFDLVGPCNAEKVQATLWSSDGADRL